MSVNFQGNTDTILQSNVLKTIGYATNSLLLYAMNSEKMSLTDFLNWAQSNDELDKIMQHQRKEPERVMEYKDWMKSNDMDDNASNSVTLVEDSEDHDASNGGAANE